MDLNSRKKVEVETQADVDADAEAQELSAARRARIASMTPRQNTQKATNQRGRRPSVDVESGTEPISRLNRYLRFWNTLRKREKELMGFLFLLCILAAAGLVGLIAHVKRRAPR